MAKQTYFDLVIPAFNEIGRIAETIREAARCFEARQFRYEITVSADCDDGTRELVTEMAKTYSTLQVLGSVERR